VLQFVYSMFSMSLDQVGMNLNSTGEQTVSNMSYRKLCRYLGSTWFPSALQLSVGILM